MEVTKDSLLQEMNKKSDGGGSGDVERANLLLKPLVAIGTDDGSIGVYDIRNQSVIINNFAERALKITILFYV